MLARGVSASMLRRSTVKDSPTAAVLFAQGLDGVAFEVLVWLALLFQVPSDLNVVNDVAVVAYILTAG